MSDFRNKFNNKVVIISFLVLSYPRESCDLANITELSERQILRQFVLYRNYWFQMDTDKGNLLANPRSICSLHEKSEKHWNHIKKAARRQTYHRFCRVMIFSYFYKRSQKIAHWMYYNMGSPIFSTFTIYIHYPTVRICKSIVDIFRPLGTNG